MQPVPRSLVWLASYPKSGNTWLRAFLANYLFESDAPIPLDDMRRVSFGDSSVEPLTRIAGTDPSTLPPDQFMRVRHTRLAEIARRGELNFVKTHNANLRVGQSGLIPVPVTHSAVYVVRDPRDMVLSYADHWAIPVEEAVRQIGRDDNTVPANAKTVAQLLSSWSLHVKSWTGKTAFRVLAIRYEDMLTHPVPIFAKVIRHVGLPEDPAMIEQAVRFSSFESLAEQEKAEGFSERGSAQARFFRSGQAGQWRDALAPELAEKIVADHGEVMQRFRYV